MKKLNEIIKITILLSLTCLAHGQESTDLNLFDKNSLTKARIECSKKDNSLFSMHMNFESKVKEDFDHVWYNITGKTLSGPRLTGLKYESYALAKDISTRTKGGTKIKAILNTFESIELDIITMSYLPSIHLGVTGNIIQHDRKVPLTCEIVYGTESDFSLSNCYYDRADNFHCY